MTTDRQFRRRVLAFDATSRGFGFVVLEGPKRMVDWGIKDSKPYDEATCLQRAAQLVDQYQPAVVVLENDRYRTRPRSERVRSLICGLRTIAEAADVPMRTISWRHVRSAFRSNGQINKHEISLAIIRVLPDFAPWCPPYRKAWMSEHHRMPAFDAAAFALTYYANLPSLRGFTLRNQDGDTPDSCN